MKFKIRRVTIFLIGAGFVVFFILPFAFKTFTGKYKQNFPTKSTIHQTKQNPNTIYSDLPPCGSEKEFFTSLPINLADLNGVVPLGNLNPTEHIFPTDHIYLHIKRSNSNDFNSPAAEVPIYSPGDLWVTRISLNEVGGQVTKGTDYSIYFTPCREFEAYYFHASTLTDRLKVEVKPPFKFCEEYETGRFKNKLCEKEVRIKISSGELIGTAGKLDWQYSFDLGASDLRSLPMGYTNPSRWYELKQHVVCPLDYFNKETGDQLRARLGDSHDLTLRTIEPICGEVEQDEAGTAQGVWFVKGTTNTYPEDPHLSLVHDNIDPTKGVFAVGKSTGKSGLNPNLYYFKPTSSGIINRDFKEVRGDNKIYCYDKLIDKSRKVQSSLIILIQLKNPTTLQIEGQNANDCGTGPWNFTSSFSEFER